MRLVYKLFPAAGVLALLVGAVPAQPPGTPGGGWPTFFSNKDVQKELKLSDEQVARANKAVQECVQKHRQEMMMLFAPNPVPAAQDNYVKATQLLTDEVADALADMLKPEQVKRFKQLALQQTIDAAGVAVFLRPDVEKELKLTDKQKEDLKPMIDDLRKKQQDIVKDSRPDPADFFKKRRAASKESVEAAVKTLTDDQKKTWKDLVGEPFEFKPQLPGAPPDKKEPGKDDVPAPLKPPDKKTDKP